MPIREINKNAAHLITSGQVITNISSAVKELIENSLDAHSTSVEVRFRNSGLAGIEVIDNGDGISEEDFTAVALKHHTSKLEEFEDLEEVKTLGFRGEALNSLCAMANVELTTSQNDSGLATKLVFDHEGNIKQQSKTTGKKGTHVIVSDLFYNLPVRRLDLEKNIKREFSKAVSLLQSYALISSGVKLMITQIKSNSGRNIILATHGTIIDEHIVSVFGTGSLSPLTPFDLKIEYRPRRVPLAFLKRSFSKTTENSDAENDSEESGNDENDENEAINNSTKTARIKGFISKPIFGQGRSSADRQLIFVNGRPCAIPRLLRAISETYKQFNTVQVPCIFADLQLDTKDYDVNVSPDKRTIMLHNEEQLVEAIKETFQEFFAEFGHTVPSQQLQSSRPLSSEKASVEFSRQTTRNGATRNTITNFLESLTASSSPSTELSSDAAQDLIMENDDTSEVEQIYDENETTLIEQEAGPAVVSSKTLDLSASGETLTMVEGDVQTQEIFMDQDSEIQHTENEQQLAQEEEKDGEEVVITEFDQTSTQIEESSSPAELVIHEHSPEKSAHFDVTTEHQSNECGCIHDDREHVHIPVMPPKAKMSSLRTVNERAICRTGLEIIKKNWKRMNKLRNLHSTDKNKSGGITTINIPEEQASEAEKRLNLVVQKGDFLRMRVVGQFNRGFILVARPKVSGSGSDLFIVDQHASDEKYNFEQYQKDIVMERQPLVIPQRLKVSVVEELMIQNHRDMLMKNGFNVAVDETEPPGMKCSLTTIPTSKSTIFDTSDFYELLYLIGESPENKSLRCSKVRSMLAMRACRSSIMIGDSLDYDTMRKVVKHLAGLDKPWNCPHGRPTLRHLTQVSQKSGFFDDILVEG